MTELSESIGAVEQLKFPHTINNQTGGFNLERINPVLHGFVVLRGVTRFADVEVENYQFNARVNGMDHNYFDSI